MLLPGRDFERGAREILQRIQKELLPDHAADIVAINVETGEYELGLTFKQVSVETMVRRRGHSMDVPPEWVDYLCDDYFSSPLSVDGYWDETAQLWLIEPTTRIEVDQGAEFLQVGRPGVDDIGFGYRKGLDGFWAFHRMELQFQYLAPSIREFLEGWHAGRIVV